MNIELFQIPVSSSIRDSLKAISKNKRGIIFIHDLSKKKKVIGVLTDGDIRDCLLDGVKIDDKIEKHINEDFVYAEYNSPREEILKKLDSNIKIIPILKKDKSLHDIANKDYIPNPVEKSVFVRSRAPARITFGGGGSDLTYFFTKEKGAVINATISIYSHAFLSLRNDKKIIVNSLDYDKKWSAKNLDDALKIKDKSYGLFQSLFKAIKPNHGFDLTVYSDFPKESGLGGSSVVYAAIIGCFNELRTDKWDSYDIAEIAFQAERLHMEVAGGWQDQYATVFGGFNFIEFDKKNNSVHSLKISKKIILEMEENLLLFEIPKKRISKGGNIHINQKKSMESKEVNNKMKDAVNLCYEIKEQLLRGNLEKFGRSLDKAWKLKRTFSKKITNRDIDSIYNYAIKNGAIGGKLMGAGGGGYFLFYVSPSDRNQFINAMNKKGLKNTSFLFDKDGMQSWTIRQQ